MKKNVVIFIAIIIIILLAGYIIYDKVLREDVNNNNETNNKVEQENISTNPTDYLELVDKDFSDENVKVQVVEFKNLSPSNFLDKQNKLIEEIQKSINENDDVIGNYIAKSDIWYQINDNILTVYYELKETTLIGDCSTIITTNIDLTTKKELTNEEVLKLGNYSFAEFALEEYNNTLSSYDNGMKIYDSNNNEISKEDFIENKSNYLEKIESGLENIIVAYVKDNQISYSYIQTNVDLLYKYVAKGGCFPYTTKNLGNLK